MNSYQQSFNFRTFRIYLSMLQNLLIVFPQYLLLHGSEPILITKLLIYVCMFDIVVAYVILFDYFVIFAVLI
jgi:hypothetical protein